MCRPTPITAKPAAAQNGIAFTIKPQMVKPKKPANAAAAAAAKPAYVAVGILLNHLMLPAS